MQASSGSLGLVLLLVSCGVAGLAVLFLMSGLWPRRRGTTPHCRRCGYNLTGLPGEICPECGSDLDVAGVVVGERYRKTRRAWAGVVLVMLAVAVLVIRPHLMKIDWYHYKSTAGVIADLKDQHPLRQSRAWKELLRRMNDNSLSEAMLHRLVECALDGQAGKMPSLSDELADELMAFLRDRYIEMKLTGDQEARFLDQMIGMQVEIRQQVVSGDDVPCWYRLVGTGPKDVFRCGWVRDSILLDGREWQQPYTLSATQDLPDTDSSSTSIRDLPPGKHRIEFCFEMRVFEGRGRNTTRFGGVVDWNEIGGGAEAVYVKHVTCSREVEVFEEEPATLVRPIEKPELAAGLREMIRVENLHYRKPSELDGVVQVEPGLPVNVAFEIVLRHGHDEIPASMCVAKERNNADGHSWHFFANCEAENWQSVDVVLRGSSKAAKTSLHIYEYWAGELSFENLPIEQQD